LENVIELAFTRTKHGLIIVGSVSNFMIQKNKNWESLLTYLYHNRYIKNFDEDDFNQELLEKYPKNYFPTELKKLWPEKLRTLLNPNLFRSEIEPGEIIPEEKARRRYQFLIKFIDNPKNYNFLILKLLSNVS